MKSDTLTVCQITVFEALRVADAKPSDRAGIIGLGGLGHLAVMYARAMGLDPVVFSRSKNKESDAFALGAKEFRLLGDENDARNETPANINVMLLCGGSVSDLGLYDLPTSERSYADNDP